MHTLETAICAKCGKHLKMLPAGTKDALPAYWLCWCNPRCLADWIGERKKDEKSQGD